MNAFFEILNGDGQALITRQLSAQPRSRQWYKALLDLAATSADIGVTPLLMHSQSPLDNAVAPLFSCVHINGLLKLDNISITSPRFLERIGSGVREIVISDIPGEGFDPVPVDIYSKLAQHCEGVYEYFDSEVFEVTQVEFGSTKLIFPSSRRSYRVGHI